MKKILISLTIAALFFSCENEPDVDVPVVTVAISNIDFFTATCTVTVSPIGATQRAGLIIGTVSGLTTDTINIPGTLSDGQLVLTLTDLLSETLYYYKGYVSDKQDNFIYSSTSSFTSATIDLALSSNTVLTTYQGGQYNIDVSCNTSWSVESGYPSWCTVSPLSGNENGTITVTIDENTISASREAEITIRSGTVTQIISVTQGTVSMPMEMIFVKGGTFLMGAQATDPSGDNYDSEAFDDESPVHSVHLDDFYIGQIEVTQKLWYDVMKGYPVSPTEKYGLGENYPVYNVSWNDIVGTSGAYYEYKGIKYYENGFIYRLYIHTNKKCRLPSEAEWEYAARGGANNKYSGSDIADDVAWHWGNSNDESNYGTHPAGGKKPNKLGIYDMSGNVGEWCSDWYDAGYYKNSPADNPVGAVTGVGRVFRGGNWFLNAWYSRVSYRDQSGPDYRSPQNGLRLAYDAE